MSSDLREIIRRPAPFESNDRASLWNDPHISKGMLDAHLNPHHDAASYRAEVIDQGVE